MKQLIRNFASSSKRTVKSVARRFLGAMPPPKSRLAGTLAINGGTPVRNTRFRPWPSCPTTSYAEWTFSVRPALQKIFCSGIEGLPQPLAKEFAEQWAAYCNARHALLLPHGTDALRVAVAAALNHDGLTYGGEIIVPNLSFIASATAALDRRVAVALVDVDSRTLNVDPARVEEAIIPGKTKAIMVVHLFGQPADMSALKAVARKHSLKIIEDAAQAHGAIHELGRAGTLGDVAGFSFQSFKNLPAGEGGALTTNDDAIFERAYEFHNVGRRRVGGLRWAHESLGWNCRPTEYVAAILLHRLKSLEQQQQCRWERFQLFRHLVGDLSSIQPVAIGPGVLRHAVHMVALRFDRGICGGLDVNDFLKALKAEGIPVSRGYEKTMAQQPVLQKLAVDRPDYLRVMDTPIANEVVKHLIYLPQHIFLADEEDIRELAAAFRKVEAHYGKRNKISLSGAETPRNPSTPAKAAIVSDTVPTLRVGIVGAGFMGLQHAQALSKSRNFTLAGISDMNREAAKNASEKYECSAYESAERLMTSGKIDVAVIATPHWQHAELAIMALEKGLHVICEKPLTVTVGQADALLTVAARSRKLFAAVHQTRLEPSYRYVKNLLDTGELGAVYRCSMVESAWRTDAYYRSSPWRGTWKGEGGGVLLNQAPHVLDRYYWLCGMPVSVLGNCDTFLHDIEVEDTVSAIFRHSNGIHGSIHVNTIECPPVSETVICCDKGKIYLNCGHVRVSRLKCSIREATRTDTRPWGTLDSETTELEFTNGDFVDTLLVGFYENFSRSASGTDQLICSGADARNAVELANAIVLSSAERREVQLPLDRAAYTDFIEKKLVLAVAT